jgi:ABC-type transport system involved in multi-copper enzyme maturation permease subunit
MTVRCNPQILMILTIIVILLSCSSSSSTTNGEVIQLETAKPYSSILLSNETEHYFTYQFNKHTNNEMFKVLATVNQTRTTLYIRYSAPVSRFSFNKRSEDFLGTTKSIEYTSCQTKDGVYNLLLTRTTTFLKDGISYTIEITQDTDNCVGPTKYFLLSIGGIIALFGVVFSIMVIVFTVLHCIYWKERREILLKSYVATHETMKNNNLELIEE